jgi:hypothetical protein
MTGPVEVGAWRGPALRIVDVSAARKPSRGREPLTELSLTNSLHTFAFSFRFVEFGHHGC